MRQTLTPYTAIPPSPRSTFLFTYLCTAISASGPLWSTPSHITQAFVAGCRQADGYKGLYANVLWLGCGNVEKISPQMLARSVNLV